MPITIRDGNQQLDAAGIQDLLGTCEVGIGRQWKFPHPSQGDGRVGKLTVSEYREVTVEGANQPLAMHVTFQIPTLTIPSLATVRRELQVNVPVTLSNLHLTARPLNSQLTISADGASIVQSQVSIHRGRANDWSHVGDQQRQDRLAVALGLNAGAGFLAAITAALADYDGNYIGDLGPLVVQRIQYKIKDRLVVPKEPVSDRNPAKLDTLPVNVNVTRENW
jgi:hypothetical protein